MKIFKYFFLGLVFQIDSTLAQSENDLLKECLESTDINICDIAQQRLAAMSNFQDALTAAERNCDLNPEKCGQSYYLAEDIGPAMADIIFNKMKARCNKNIMVCDDLSSIYELRKDYKSALSVARKYYDKTGKGRFPLFSYKYGNDKKLAYKTSLKSCKESHSDCIFILRNMPDHPQYSEIVNLSEKACRNLVYPGSGSTDCAIIGSYYFKLKNYKKAYDLWSTDYKTNTTSCLLIIGSEKFDKIKTFLALEQFCKITGSMPGPHKYLQDENCTAIAPDKIIPIEILDEGIATIRGFLQQQK